jgi:hypothetical protein
VGRFGWSRFRGGSDRELISSCREDKTGAWEAMLEKYERLVFSIPLNYRLPRADAADVSQLTFTILIQSPDSLGDVVAAWVPGSPPSPGVTPGASCSAAARAPEKGRIWRKARRSSPNRTAPDQWNT